MAPFGGVIADKYGRARMVGITDMLAGIVLFVQVYFFAINDVPLLILILVNGCLWNFMWGIFWPAFAGVLPSVLPEHALQKGNAINSLVSNAGIILGAASAGFLVSGFGAATALAIDAFSFFIWV
jgi:predicted MFS family arabinose efflux permease